MSKFNAGAIQSTQNSEALFGNKSVKDSIMEGLSRELQQSSLGEQVEATAPVEGELVGGVDVGSTPLPQSYEDEGAYPKEMGLTPQGDVMRLGQRAAMAVDNNLNPQISTGNTNNKSLQPVLLGSGKMSEPRQIEFPTYKSTPEKDVLTNMINRSSTMAKGLVDRTLTGNWHFDSNDAPVMAQYRKDGEKTDAVKAILDKRAEKNTLAETLTTKIPNAVIINPENDQYAMNEEFGRLMSILAENHIPASILAAPDAITDPNIDDDLDVVENFGDEEAKAEGKEINPIQGAAKLGRDIIKWNDTTLESRGEPAGPKLSEREYKDLGAFALQAYQLSNPDLVMTTTDPETGGIRYSLTAKGKLETGKSEAVRNNIFNVQIPPAHMRPEKGQMSNSLQRFKPTFRKKGMMGEVGIIEESIENQSSVNHVVDQRRTRIAMAMIIPTMFRQPGMEDDHFGDIFGVGETSLRQTYAKETNLNNVPEEDANKLADGVVKSNKTNLLKQLNALVRNYHMPNYLTYAVQVLTGRTHAQQSEFNPTRNKVVRMATRGQTPTRVKRGSQQDHNMMQLFALNLLNDKQDGKGMNDLLMPKLRASAARSLLDKWYLMGKEVKALLDHSLPAKDFELIVEAIRQGVKLDDPSFPKAPIRDFGDKLPPAVRQLMKEKGEDAPMVIETLLEVVDYVDNMKNKGEHFSSLNAFIDGKTNGIALAAAILGNQELAYRTGVLRPDDAIYAVQDEDGNPWDVRDAMRNSIQTRLRDENFNWESVGLSSTISDDSKIDLIDIMMKMAEYKPLNKNISMVFPYGKELGGMINEVKNHFMDNYGEAKNQDFRDAVERLEKRGIKQEKIFKAVHANVVDALFDVFGIDTFEGRQLMRSSSFLMGVMDYNLMIEGADGMNISLGGDRMNPTSPEESTILVKNDADGTRSTLKGQVSKSYQSSAAKKGSQVGGFGVRRSVVIPVHSADASVMNRTLSGKSWARITGAYSNPNDAYVTQIYDAVKVDVNNVHIISEEVNKNFNEVVQEFDYFRRTYNAVTDSRVKFEREMKADPSQVFNITPDSRFSVIYDMIVPEIGVTDTGKTKFTHTGINGFASSITKPARGETPKEYSTRVGNVSKRFGHELKMIIPSMGDANVDFGNPPDKLSARQILAVSELMFRFSEYSKQSNQFLDRIKRQREELFRHNREMKRKTGVGTTQFHAH